jgi:hypothetical protein
MRERDRITIEVSRVSETKLELFFTSQLKPKATYADIHVVIDRSLN